MITANGSSAINTSGEKAHGIWAQSLGGGGASVSAALKTLPAGTVQRSNSSGSGGEIRIRFNGTIDTQGAGSYGVFAQRGFQNAQGILDPGRTGGDILVDYTDVLNGGDKTGAAIVVDGGRSNTILINPGSTVSARSGTAVIATSGNDMLSNAGTLIGDIDLASGNTTELNEFHNAAVSVCANRSVSGGV